MDASLYSIYFGSMSVCLNMTNFAFVRIDFDFPKYDFCMLTLDTFKKKKRSFLVDINRNDPQRYVVCEHSNTRLLNIFALARVWFSLWNKDKIIATKKYLYVMFGPLRIFYLPVKKTQFNSNNHKTAMKQSRRPSGNLLPVLKKTEIGLWCFRPQTAIVRSQAFEIDWGRSHRSV